MHIYTVEICTFTVEKFSFTPWKYAHLHSGNMHNLAFAHEPLSSCNSHPGKKHTGYVGLKNQGATCYMNSLLQVGPCHHPSRRYKPMTES